MSWDISAGLIYDLTINAENIYTISGEFAYITLSSYAYEFEEDISGNATSDIVVSDVIYNAWASQEGWNRFKSMYVLGSIDTSNGSIWIRQGSLYVGQSINNVIKFYNAYPSIQLNSDTYISDIPYEITIANYNFELPVITTNTYLEYDNMTTEQKAELKWYKGGNYGGILSNGGTSIIRGPYPYPSGNQCMCIYHNSTRSMCQSFYLYSGNYRLSFYLANRYNYAELNDINVHLNDTLLGIYTPTYNVWILVEINFSIDVDGNYQIKFSGTTMQTCSCIDNVSITRTDNLVRSNQIGYLKNVQYDINTALTTISNTINNNYFYLDNKINSIDTVSQGNYLYNYVITLSSSVIDLYKQDGFNINNLYSGLTALSGLVVGYHIIQNGYLQNQLNSINNAFSGLTSLSGLVVGYHIAQNGYLQTQLNSINNAFSGLTSLSGLVVGYYLNHNSALQTQLNSINTAFGGLSSLSGIVYSHYINNSTGTINNNIGVCFSGLSSLSGLVVSYYTTHNGYLQTQLNSINNAYSGLSSLSGLVVGYYLNHNSALQTQLNSINNNYSGLSSLSGIVWSYYKNDGLNIKNLQTATTGLTYDATIPATKTTNPLYIQNNNAGPFTGLAQQGTLINWNMTNGNAEVDFINTAPPGFATAECGFRFYITTSGWISQAFAPIARIVRSGIESGGYLRYRGNQDVETNFNSVYSYVSSLSGAIIGYHQQQNSILDTQLNSINNLYNYSSSLSGAIIGYHQQQNSILNTQLNSINNLYNYSSSLSGAIIGYHQQQNSILNSQLNSINNAYSGLSSLSGIVYNYYKNDGFRINELETKTQKISYNNDKTTISGHLEVVANIISPSFISTRGIYRLEVFPNYSFSSTLPCCRFYTYPYTKNKILFVSPVGSSTNAPPTSTTFNLTLNTGFTVLIKKNDVNYASYDLSTINITKSYTVGASYWSFAQFFYTINIEVSIDYEDAFNEYEIYVYQTSDNDKFRSNTTVSTQFVGTGTVTFNSADGTGFITAGVSEILDETFNTSINQGSIQANIAYLNNLKVQDALWVGTRNIYDAVAGVESKTSDFTRTALSGLLVNTNVALTGALAMNYGVASYARVNDAITNESIDISMSKLSYLKNVNSDLNAQITSSNTNINNLYSSVSSISGIVWSYYKNDGFNINNLYSVVSSISGIIRTYNFNDGFNINNNYSALASLSGIVWSQFKADGSRLQSLETATTNFTYHATIPATRTTNPLYIQNNNAGPFTGLAQQGTLINWNMTNGNAEVDFINTAPTGFATADSGFYFYITTSGWISQYCTPIAKILRSGIQSGGYLKYKGNQDVETNFNSVYSSVFSLSGILSTYNINDGFNINNLLTKTTALSYSNNITTISNNINIIGNITARKYFTDIPGTANTGFGLFCMDGMTTGGAYNVAFGREALKYLTGGSWNTAIGLASLQNCQNHANTGVGGRALMNCIDGGSNTVIGDTAGFLVNASLNTIVGRYAMMNCINGYSNCIMGFSTGNKVYSSNNTLIGTYADFDSISGFYQYSSALGFGAIINASNQITLGRATETVYIPGGLKLDGNLNVNSITISPTELSYLDGATSNIQTNFNNLYNYSNSLSGAIIGYHQQQNAILDTQLNSINNLYNYSSSLSGVIIGYHQQQNSILNSQLNSINNLYSSVSSLSGMIIGYHSAQNQTLNTQLNSINNLYSSVSSLSGMIIGYHSAQNQTLNTQLNSINTCFGGIWSLSGIVYANYLNTNTGNINNNIGVCFSGLSSLSGVVWSQYKSDGSRLYNLEDKMTWMSRNGVDTSIIGNMYLDRLNIGYGDNYFKGITYLNQTDILGYAFGLSGIIQQNIPTLYNWLSSLSGTIGQNTANLYSSISTLSGIVYSINFNTGSRLYNLEDKTEWLSKVGANNSITGNMYLDRLNIGYGDNYFKGITYFNETDVLGYIKTLSGKIGNNISNLYSGLNSISSLVFINGYEINQLKTKTTAVSYSNNITTISNNLLVSGTTFTNKGLSVITEGYGTTQYIKFENDSLYGSAKWSGYTKYTSTNGGSLGDSLTIGCKTTYPSDSYIHIIQAKPADIPTNTMGCVGINTTVPVFNFDISGTFRATQSAYFNGGLSTNGPLVYQVSTITATSNLSNPYYNLYIINSTGATTITLTNAGTFGQILMFRCSNNCDGNPFAVLLKVTGALYGNSTTNVGSTGSNAGIQINYSCAVTYDTNTSAWYTTYLS